MARHSKTWMGGGLLAVLGLSALSPVQQGSVALTVAGAALWSAPALAHANIPGIGIVVKSDCAYIPKPCKGPIIIAPTDASGEVRLTGLTPGEYEVKLFGNSKPMTMTAGKDGRLAFVALRDVKGGPSPRAMDPRARRALPVVREWVERCCDNYDPPESRAAFDVTAPMPDVNTSTAEQLMAGTNNSQKTAGFIVAERKRGGPYKDPLDFAQRVGGTVSVDFGYSSVRIGDTTIIARGGEPKANGFKAVRGSGVVELYNAKHNSVGHVTLLR